MVEFTGVAVVHEDVSVDVVEATDVVDVNC